MTIRRLHPTLADYIAIAINPVLVMGLIGSLIYFLLEVMYQGAYPDRLQFCLSMFILGTVLISRIAMEDGYEHAAPFGVGLAVVVALALNRFVDYGHGTLASFGWAINWGLMALTWWCAHQLTWDCTILDDTSEPESQGLLETVGIDKATGAPAINDPAATAEYDEPSAPNDASDRRGRVLAGWEQILNRKGRPHAPGVWVVYFSLASLPIFGIGQLCIPASNTPSRRYVFGLLCVYVACGLGLLLTTSFLALRRYLRRRRLEMPAIMAGTWLATGAVLIVVLLLFVALLPRPNPEYPISELPLKFSSHEHGSSKLSVGEEGTNDDQATSGSGVDHSRDGTAEGERQKAGGGRQKTEESGTSEGKSQLQQSQSQHGQSEKAQSEKGPSQQTPGKADAGKSQSDAKPDGAQQNDTAKSPDQNSAAKPAQQNDAKQPPSSPSNKSASNSAGGAASNPASAVAEVGSAIGGVLAATFKWLFYAALILAVAWFAWKSRERLLAILRGWIDEWRKFWAEFWGRPKPAADGVPLPAVSAALRQQRFADFIDPFAAGTARQHSPAELVKYTFAALEAWGGEHGCERSPDATPHEFARQVGGQFQPIAADTRLLADLYCRALYSQGDLPPGNLSTVRQIWQALRSIDAQLVTDVPRG